jgi:hypothetical protein
VDLHRARVPNRIDLPSGRPCEFCKRLDPEFERRNAIDQLVAATAHDLASSHLTEDGHVRHRLAELRERLDPLPFSLGATVA